jgi:hypothetical protein
MKRTAQGGTEPYFEARPKEAEKSCLITNRVACSSTARRQNRLEVGKEVGKIKRRMGSNNAFRLRVSPRKHTYSGGLGPTVNRGVEI